MLNLSRKVTTPDSTASFKAIHTTAECEVEVRCTSESLNHCVIWWVHACIYMQNKESEWMLEVLIPGPACVSGCATMELEDHWETNAAFPLSVSCRSEVPVKQMVHLRWRRHAERAIDSETTLNSCLIWVFKHVLLLLLLLLSVFFFSFLHVLSVAPANTQRFVCSHTSSETHHHHQADERIDPKSWLTWS